eukprot:NODE_401_length_9344_cov_0.427366.p2 type:complete len:371 gc:universal NODE_401_length_9344_cov_0.427366:1204-2316(+)
MREQQTNVQFTATTQVSGDLQKKLKQSAPEGEPAWKVVDQNAIGMYIWRIEKFQPKVVAKEQYGKFYDGDSYLVLNAYKSPGSNTLKYDLHFWLGTETTQDEAGTAAYKTVELDDYLGGAPVQYREVQGSESSLFLSYFPVFLVQHGGVDSGFTKVKPADYKPRLLHVKGSRKKLVVRQVELHTDSMNSGDVFILDTGLEIFQWNGEKAAAWEKNKANELVRSIQQERLGKPKTFVFDESDKNITEFYAKLGSNGPIKSAEEGGDDNTVANLTKNIYRLSDASGQMTFTKETLATGKLARAQLDQNDVFVIDNGTDVFVWIGKATTAAERAQGLQYAEKYLVEFGKPLSTPISKTNQGNESDFFWKSFDA